MYKITFISLLIFLFTSCSKDDGKHFKSSCVQNTNTQILVHDDTEREYIVHIPNGYTSANKTPLLFNFHGFGGTVNDYIKDADMRNLADAQNFILVYPQGTCLNGSSHWNAGLDQPDNKSDADDFGFIEALIQKLSSTYNIDSERIYACGYSNGGMFSYALGCYKSNLIAAVASVSGTMLYTNCTPTHPVPIMNIHGTSDQVIPYSGNSYYNSVETVLGFWNTVNNTNTTPLVNNLNSNGTQIEHYQYTGGNNGSAVEHYKVVNGNHVWFNLNVNNKNTGALIWDFVSQYDVNGLM